MSTLLEETQSSVRPGPGGGPIRVLYSFPHRLGMPGIGTIAAWQIRGLIEQGLRVSLWCTSLASDLPGADRLVQTMVICGLRVPHRAIGIERAYRYHDWKVARALRRLATEIDLVHCWPLASVHTMRVARQLGIPSVREVPNSHTEFAMARAAQEAEAVGIKNLPRGYSHRPNPRRLDRERTEYRLADLLLVPSGHVEQTFLDRGFPRGRVVRHQYGFDPSRFPAPPDEVRPRDRPLTALFVGFGEPRKGLHHALKAWVDSGVAQRGRFIICGGFLPGYRRFLAPLLAHPSVQVRGFVEDVGAVMREADVFIFPSVEEGSALVTYEAQASGCVLLVSDAAGAVCRAPDQALVHRAGDVQTLTEHLQLLDRDREQLARLRARTLSRRSELTWSVAAQRLASIYAGCVRAKE